jgi:hypothetical protein
MIEIDIDLQKIGIGGEFRRFTLESFAKVVTANYDARYIVEVTRRDNDRVFVFDREFYTFVLEKNCSHDLDSCAKEFAEKKGYKYFIKIIDEDGYCITCAREKED